MSLLQVGRVPNERAHDSRIDKTCTRDRLTRTRDCLPLSGDDDESMEARLLSAAVFAALALIAVGPARTATSGAPTQAQVIKRFEKSTGRKLAADAGSTRAGHYTALRLSKSVTNVALYGDFTLWLVAPGTLEDDVTQLLTNAHTGELGAPGAAGIYWEQTSSFGGGTAWLAKKRYGPNLVLWRYGTTRKVDPAFKRLHKALLKVVAGS
jgi:hypothetical protein